MPEIPSDNGHPQLSLRPPGRSQLASLLGLWSRRTARFAFLQAAEASCLNSGEIHEDILSSLTADEAVAFGVVKPLSVACQLIKESYSVL
jgi:hypothetical protein